MENKNFEPALAVEDLRRFTAQAKAVINSIVWSLPDENYNIKTLGALAWIVGDRLDDIDQRLDQLFGKQSGPSWPEI